MQSVKTYLISVLTLMVIGKHLRVGSNNTAVRNDKTLRCCLLSPHLSAGLLALFGKASSHQLSSAAAMKRDITMRKERLDALLDTRPYGVARALRHYYRRLSAHSFPIKRGVRCLTTNDYPKSNLSVCCRHAPRAGLATAQFYRDYKYHDAGMQYPPCFENAGEWVATMRRFPHCD